MSDVNLPTLEYIEKKIAEGNYDPRWKQLRAALMRISELEAGIANAIIDLETVRQEHQKKFDDLRDKIQDLEDEISWQEELTWPCECWYRGELSMDDLQRQIRIWCEKP